jgi:hypothetical protein
MQGQHQQQEKTGRPDQLRVALEKVAVAIDGFRTEENLEVAGQVPNDEQEHHEAADRHDVLLAERRLKDIRQQIHQKRDLDQPKIVPGWAKEI